MDRPLACTRNARASLIRLRTEDGIEGIGDARAPVGFVRAAIEMMKPAFIGSNLHDRDAVFNRFFNSVYHMGHQGALIAAYSGLNIAMFDAIGKGLGLSVCKLLGGMVRSEVPVYATGGHFTLNNEADLGSAIRRASRSWGRWRKDQDRHGSRNPTLTEPQLLGVCWATVCFWR